MFEKGNTYWKQIANWGRGNERKYIPETLWAKALEYFDWIISNPWREQTVSAGKILSIEKPRPMTIYGFCSFANMTFDTYNNYRKEDAYLDITTRIDDIIRDYKLCGAEAGAFHPNIVARQLSLADKQEVKEESTITKICFGEEDQGL